MRKVSLSENGGVLEREAAEGLKALGWTLVEGRLSKAELRVIFIKASEQPSLEEGAWGSVVLVTTAPDKPGLSELSLHLQKLAIRAAPESRVNGIAVAQGWEKELAASIDWLAGAAMVTGQLILLSSEPAPSIPL